MNPYGVIYNLWEWLRSAGMLTNLQNISHTL